MKNLIYEGAQRHLSNIIANRHHLHANPELSFKEYNTVEYVAEQLRSYGLSPQEGVADTGLVALIEGGKPGPVVALRADMDALPIQEENDVPYKSTVPGVMHACGHDVHTSSLLGVAKILSEIKEELPGTIKLVFQPGEERAPGGASMMIKQGALKNPEPKSMLGQHVMPLIPAGKVGFREGMYMASADEIYLTVKGKGGHGAMPENAVDPILITSHIIVAAQQIISRNSSPKVPSVLTFGRVEANGATNIIPNKVEVQGTFRTLNEEWREDALKRLRQMATLMAESMGGVCEVNIIRGYPYLSNDPEVARRSKMAAVEYLGKENVVDLDIWMAAEDFSYYSHEVPSCFYRLGTRNEEQGIVSGVHTPTFNIDEDALAVGAGLMAWLAVAELQQG